MKNEKSDPRKTFSEGGRAEDIVAEKVGSSPASEEIFLS